MRDEIDEIIDKILVELGVDRTKPPKWLENIYEFSDGRKMKKGYTCSFCGKHSWGRAQECDGCHSIMQNAGSE